MQKRHRQQILFGVIAILSIAAIIQIRRHSRELEMQEALTANLRGLITPQETFFADHAHYTTPDSLGYKSDPRVPPPQVTPNGTSWSAVNASVADNIICGVAVNTMNPVNHLAEEQKVACAPLRYFVGTYDSTYDTKARR